MLRGMAPRECAYRRAFSITELLIVISIIGTLSGLLLPLVRQVRTSARELVCQAHLRQIGMAIHAYAADWNGRLVRGYDTKSGFWFYALRDYADVENAPVHTRNVLRGCPDWDANVRKQGLIGLPWYVGYGMNQTPIAPPNPWNATTNFFGSSGFTQFRDVRLVEMAPADRRILVGDNVQFYICAGPGWWWDGGKRLHRGKDNYLFLDGHVQRLAPGPASWGCADPYRAAF
jgi:prepilin-type N-terminal cleavage/methylation domain-containing protein/prepilin-type processing-associated H-X9-DG protein